MNNLSFPLFVTWSITSYCNLRCKHCFRTEYDCSEFTEESIDKFIDLFIDKKVNRVILTGGEPLKSKYLFHIVKRLCSKIKVGIATNGVLLNENKITKLLEYKVKDYQISLDGATKIYNDFIRGKGVYDKVINNIKLLNKYNCNITVAVVVNSYNYDDVYNNILDTVRNLGVKKLRIEYYIPVNKNEYFDSVSLDKMKNIEEHLTKNSDGIKIQFPKLDSENNCGAGIYNCVLNSDMTISPCDLLTHKYRSKKITDINLFQKYWLEDDKFLEWRRKISCLNCNNKYRCLAMEEINND